MMKIRHSAAFHRRSFLGILGGGAATALAGGNPNIPPTAPYVPTPMEGAGQAGRSIGECGASAYDPMNYVRDRIDHIDNPRACLERKGNLRAAQMETDLAAMRSLSPTTRARLLAERRAVLHRQFTLDEALLELNPQQRAKLLAEEKIAAFFSTSFLNE